ncbi:MAG: hypothetical protein E7179_06410 [Erysipelotrichaceae bacterium]|jgi:hypothetical protein|nr:hypothetical protein [Erysipelotrichaceae bacterium]
MKKGIIASLVALTSGAAIAAFALRGPDKLVDLRVNAEPQEYSVTFNESNTTVEQVGKHYAIYATTPRGAKVGVVGYDNSDASFTFKGTHFRSLQLFDPDDSVLTGRAFEFSHITGFAISFSGDFGDDMVFIANGGETTIEEIASGAPHTGLSFAPEDCPMFYTGDRVNVSSLKVFYSC